VLPLQVIEGLAAIALLTLVARRFPRQPGCSRRLLALTPISVGSTPGNTDSCLVLVLLVAAWATVATERGSVAPAASMALPSASTSDAGRVGGPAHVRVRLLFVAPRWRDASRT
jgi:hypothetical protein